MDLFLKIESLFVSRKVDLLIRVGEQSSAF